MTNQSPHHSVAKVATAKAVSDADYKLLSAELPPGVTPVHCTIEIVGTLKKGNPFMQKFPNAANPWAILAKALSKLNTASIESLVRESLEVNPTETAAVKQAAEEAIERLVAATEREVSGRVVAHLQLSVK